MSDKNEPTALVDTLPDSPAAKREYERDFSRVQLMPAVSLDDTQPMAPFGMSLDESASPVASGNHTLPGGFVGPTFDDSPMSAKTGAIPTVTMKRILQAQVPNVHQTMLGGFTAVDEGLAAESMGSPALPDGQSAHHKTLRRLSHAARSVRVAWNHSTRMVGVAQCRPLEDAFALLHLLYETATRQDSLDANDFAERLERVDAGRVLRDDENG